MSTNKTDAHNNDDSKSSSITETGDLLTSPKNADLSISKPDSELERNGDTKIEKNEGIESHNETDDQSQSAVSELPENDHHSSLQNEAEENKSNNVTDYEKIKEQFLTLNPEKKRELYKCSKYLTLKQIQIWPDYYSDNNYLIERKCPVKRDPNLKFKDVNEGLNTKISLIRDDITSLEVCAIVNAANKTLLGGGGVDGAIHRAAGKYLLKECKTLNGCETGEAKITGGYKLPAKYVIHTVGPIGEKPSKLKNCYLNSLNLLKANNLKSIAFPCISTGIYGYPNKSAAKVALETVREWLETEDNAENIERIIFCCFLQKDIDIYHAYLPAYFPLSSSAKPAPSTSEK